MPTLCGASVTTRPHGLAQNPRIGYVNALHPLGQLFQSVEDSKGWTLREIARRIERSGRTISHAYVARLKREPIKSITYDTIHALSVGLDVPERVVALAAVESMGVHDVNPAEAGAAVAIARDPSLSERDRRVLLAVVREMQREDDEAAGEQLEAEAGGVQLESEAEPDGVTVKPDTGGMKRWSKHRQAAFAERDDEAPWKRGDFDLAAKRGRNRGAEARRQQDREAEDGGA